MSALEQAADVFARERAEHVARFLMKLLASVRMMFVALVLGAGSVAAVATISSALSTVTVPGNGAQTSFSFPFIGVAASDITVVLTNSAGAQTTLVQGTGTTQYQVTLNAIVPPNLWGVGGAIAYNPSGTPVPSGSTLTITRVLPYLQTVSLQNQASFGQLAQATEQGLDLLDMQIQQLATSIAHTIQAPLSDPSGLTYTLPSATARAGQFLCFDGAGNVNSCTAVPMGTVSSAMQPVVNAASLSAGRLAFGLGSMAQENVNGGTCGGTAIQDDGSGGGPNGIGYARIVLTTVADSTNQSVACSFAMTQRIATGAIAYTLPRASTSLFNGFGFWIYAQASGGPVTITPNGSDNFVGLSSGTPIVLQPNTWVWISTNAASSAVWYAATWNASARSTLLPGTSVNYYVNASASPATCGPTGALTCGGGNDTTGTGTQAAPWRTLQNAVNFIIQSVDIAGASPIINLAHGSSANYQLSCQAGPFLGTSVISIVGDRSSITAVTVVDAANGSGLSLKDGCTLAIDSIAFADAASNNAAFHILVGSTGNAAHLDYANVTLGALGVGTQMAAGNLGSIAAVGPLIFAGNAPLAIDASQGGYINFDINNGQIPIALSYSVAFAFISDGGVIGAQTTTFTGAGVAGTTGPQCIVSGVGNAGAVELNTIFPGNAKCVNSLLIGATQLTLNPLNTYPACSSATKGAVIAVSNSNTSTWGATIASGGSSPVLGFCDGGNYTVFAK